MTSKNYLDKKFISKNDLDYDHGIYIQDTWSPTHTREPHKKTLRQLFRLLQCCVLLLSIYSLTSKLLQYNHSAASHEDGKNPDPLEDLCPNLPLSGLQYLNFEHGEISQPINEMYEGCSSIAAFKKHYFEFNIHEDTTARQWSLLDSISSEAGKNLQGEINIDRGNLSQSSDIEVHIIVRSTNETDVNNVQFDKKPAALHVDYQLGDGDHCTEVQVFVFLRPWPRQILDRFTAYTNLFDVRVKPSLNWEINELVIRSSNGNIAFNTDVYKDPLIAHNVSVSSTNGNIFGCYIPDSNLEIRNKYGLTIAILVPNLTPDAPEFDPKIISISSLVEIRAGAIFDAWPSKAYTHRTKIETAGGMLIAQLPHGSHTNYTSQGTMMGYIQPYGADTSDAQSEIYTSSGQFDSEVIIAGPPPESLDGRFNPLLNTISEHNVDRGWLVLNYDVSWWGELEAINEHGRIEIQKLLWNIIDVREGYLKARRGENGTSQMRTHVGGGVLDIRLWG